MVSLRRTLPALCAATAACVAAFAVASASAQADAASAVNYVHKHQQRPTTEPPTQVRFQIDRHTAEKQSRACKLGTAHVRHGALRGHQTREFLAFAARCVIER